MARRRKGATNSHDEKTVDPSERVKHPQARTSIEDEVHGSSASKKLSPAVLTRRQKKQKGIELQKFKQSEEDREKRAQRKVNKSRKAEEAEKPLSPHSKYAQPTRVNTPSTTVTVGTRPQQRMKLQSPPPPPINNSIDTESPKVAKTHIEADLSSTERSRKRIRIDERNRTASVRSRSMNTERNRSHIPIVTLDSDADEVENEFDEEDHPTSPVSSRQHAPVLSAVSSRSALSNSGFPTLSPEITVAAEGVNGESKMAHVTQKIMSEGSLPNKDTGVDRVEKADSPKMMQSEESMETTQRSDIIISGRGASSERQASSDAVVPVNTAERRELEKTTAQGASSERQASSDEVVPVNTAERRELEKTTAQGASFERQASSDEVVPVNTAERRELEKKTAQDNSNPPSMSESCSAPNDVEPQQSRSLHSDATTPSHTALFTTHSKTVKCLQRIEMKNGRVIRKWKQPSVFHSEEPEESQVTGVETHEDGALNPPSSASLLHSSHIASEEKSTDLLDDSEPLSTASAPPSSSFSTKSASHPSVSHSTSSSSQSNQSIVSSVSHGPGSSTTPMFEEIDLFLPDGDTPPRARMLARQAEPAESPAPLPSVQTESPAPLPSVQTESPAPLPSVQTESPAPLPSVQTESPAPLPSVQTESPAPLPSVQTESPAPLPSVQTESPAPLIAMGTVDGCSPNMVHTNSCNGEAPTIGNRKRIGGPDLPLQPPCAQMSTLSTRPDYYMARDSVLLDIPVYLAYFKPPKHSLQLGRVTFEATIPLIFPYGSYTIGDEKDIESARLIELCRGAECRKEFEFLESFSIFFLIQEERKREQRKEKGEGQSEEMEPLNNEVGPSSTRPVPGQ